MIIERELLGGECSYWACMPRKALLRPAHARGRAAPAARRWSARSSTPPPCSPAATSIAHDWDDGPGRLAERAGITSSAATAGSPVRARVVDGPDGESAHRPACRRRVHRQRPGPARQCPAWTRCARGPARDATSTKESRRGWSWSAAAWSPARWPAFRRLGSQVTLLQRGHAAAADAGAVRRGAGRRGAARGGRRRPARTPRWTRSSATGDAVDLHVGDETIAADEILYATGRRPNTATSAWSRRPGARRDADRGRLRAGRRASTGMALRRGRRHRPGPAHPPGQVPGPHRRRGDRGPGRRRSRWTPTPWGEHAATADHAAVPQVVFTDPEVASVGLTEARGPGRPGGTCGWSTCDRGRRLDRAGRRIRRPGPPGRRPGPGGAASGPPSSARTWPRCCTRRRWRSWARCRWHRLWHAVPAYPTISEVWLRLLEAYRAPSPDPDR